MADSKTDTKAHQAKATVDYAQLDAQCETPTSLLFDDIYFSPADGIGESRYHFIEGNRLPQRFADFFSQPLNAGDKSVFTLAETGFGTGLNFLLTADLWLSSQQSASRNVDATLHYLSVEKYPIASRQLDSIYRAQGWQNAITEALLAQYPTALTGGTHEILLNLLNLLNWSNTDNGTPSVHLTLLLGDATEQFNAYPFTADAWFLDGFAPNKNPQMWTPELFEVMAKRSQADTTFATFTAASAVRKGLQNAGFTVRKGKGFGRKRERLLGEYSRPLAK